MLGSGEGELGGGNSFSLLGRAQPRFSLREQFCSAGLFCVLPLSVSLLLLFPLFAVLLNCPYPDPPVFCLFLSILLLTPAGGGRLRGAFVAGGSQNQNTRDSISLTDYFHRKS